MQTYKHLLSTCEYSFVGYLLIMQGDLLCNILLFVAHSLSSVVHASHLKSPDNIGQTADVCLALWVSRLLWMKPVLFPLLWKWQVNDWIQYCEHYNYNYAQPTYPASLGCQWRCRGVSRAEHAILICVINSPFLPLFVLLTIHAVSLLSAPQQPQKGSRRHPPLTLLWPGC